ncbi:Retrovirus-related Pol polyprotein from transposon TNT 1-94 [Rhizoctonia solani]|uniref:Retrovirus-related Pol polyprotein from transposon TNT 1-94 n=1 Tax=Rhizoctonia solani TaxID=456999 RepID=A0A0K6FTP9_9AGAM|nr:Retrovirus-related Pol polyprotein from transposon TNT 1-94 [Rhizoctonia solani]
MDRDRLEILGTNNEIVIVGSKIKDRQEGSLWKIDTETMSTPAEKPEMHIPTELVLTKQTGRTWFEWHKVLGHIGPQALQRLKSTNAVNGMEVTEDGIGLNFECEVCMQSKAHTRPFPKESQSKVSEIGELVVTDVWGPARTPSIGRFRYYVSFTDVATRFTRLGFLKHKDETLSEYKVFEALINTQKNKKIKRVRFDNGREFVNKDWIEHTNQKGTILETTAPYSAQQNGIAERLNRTLTEKARAMLIESAAPKFLWSEAIAYACYLKNRVPTQVHGKFWKSPYEAFWGKRPDGESQSKMDSKTLTALFTGISDFQGKSWRYYKTGANRILHSRNITFPRSHAAAEGAYSESDWGEAVVPPAEGEERKHSGSTAEQRDENARTGGAQRVSSEAKEETKPHSEPKDIRSEVKSEQTASDSSKPTTESKPIPHAVVHKPSSTRSKLTMPSGNRTDTANSIRKINALSSVNTSGVRTRRGNPNMPAISLEKEHGGVKISVKDTAAASPRQYDSNSTNYVTNYITEHAGYCDDTGSEDSDAFIQGVNAYIQGIDACTHGTNSDAPGAHSDQVGTIGSARSLHSDLPSLYSSIPSPIPDGDTTSLASAPTVPSELAYQLASPTEAWIPSYTPTGELDGRFGELKLTSERFPPPAESALERLEEAEPHWALAARLSAPKDNPSVEEALAGPDKEKWWKAMVEEHTTLEKRGTFTESLLPKGRKAMGCKWVLTLKRDENGNPVRYKARLVAQGFSQQPGVDYGKTFAPVNNWDIRQLDVTSAFLHADVEEELYMQPIPYFDNGYLPCLTDSCVYRRIMDVSGQLHVSVIATHVDDSILITTPNSTDFALSELLREFEMRDLGPIHHFLGISFKRYKELGLNDAYPADTPMSPNVQLTRHEGTKPKFDYGTFIGYSDADWGSNLLDRKSVSGNVYLLGGAAVSWSAKKQATVALSTMEAEYMALSHACTQALWFHNLAALTLSTESQFHGRSKHIDIRHHFMRDVIEKHMVSTLYVPSSENLADVFTKALPAPQFNYLMNAMMGEQVFEEPRIEEVE